MKITMLLNTAVVCLSALNFSGAEEPVRKRLARSIPEDVVFCARLDLNVVRKTQEAAGLYDAATRQFKEQLDAIAQFSDLNLADVKGLWVGVVKDKEALVVLDGHFDTALILNSQIVTHSRRLVRPGTLVAIEMYDEKKDETSHGVVINQELVAFGLPSLVDRFIANVVNGRSGWGPNALGNMERLAASEAMLHVAVLQMPPQLAEEKPFLSNLVSAQVEANVGEKVAVLAKIAMRDEMKAAALKDLISGFVGLGLASEIKGNYPEIRTAIFDALKSSHEGKTVTLSSGMDAALLRDVLRRKGLDLPP